MDYIRNGVTQFWYVDPPRLNKEELAFFSDSLDEIYGPKLQELLERFDIVEAEYDERMKIFKAWQKAGQFVDDEVHEYFYLIGIEHEHAESFVIQKWLRYWLSVYYHIHNKNYEETKFDELAVRLAKQVPLEEIYGGELKRRGRLLAGVCPFHNERTPSFHIYPEENRFHCFGCSADGDAIDFIMRLKDLKFKEAVTYLL